MKKIIVITILLLTVIGLTFGFSQTQRINMLSATTATVTVSDSVRTNGGWGSIQITASSTYSISAGAKGYVKIYGSNDNTNWSTKYDGTNSVVDSMVASTTFVRVLNPAVWQYYKATYTKANSNAGTIDAVLYLFK